MSDQIETLPRRSRRLATIIPASHWMSIGYSPEAAQGMESLQNDLKKYYEGASIDNVICQLVSYFQIYRREESKIQLKSIHMI